MGECNGPAHVTGRRPSAWKGQAYILFALALPVVCGMLALAVDVGTTTARHQQLQHAADNAAEAGAYALYGWRSGANPSLTDNEVWTAIASKLTTDGLTVRRGTGG